MKKFIVFALTLLLLSVTSIGVMADSSTGLEVTSSKLDNGNYLVYASIVNINDPVGLCGIDYDIIYDNTVLAIQSAETNIPQQWSKFVENEMVEDWSYQKAPNVYSWGVLNCEPGYGIKNDNELYIKIEFAPLAEADTTISFKKINVINDDVAEIGGESKTLQISIDGSYAVESGVSADAGANKDIVAPGGDTSDSGDNTSDYFIIIIVILVIVAGAVAAFVFYSKKGKK